MSHTIVIFIVACVAIPLYFSLFGRKSVSGHSHAGPPRVMARHEAGHAAAIKYYGGTITSTYLDSNSGYVKGNMTGDPKARIAMLLAGAEAAGTDEGASGDFYLIKQELKRTTNRSAVLNAAKSDARHIVRSRSGQIERYADRFQKYGRL